MKKVEITINGKAYPCRQTMGAMLRFKMETGKEVSAISNDVTDMCTYLFCCIASACKHDGVEFGLSLMDFADSVTLDDSPRGRMPSTATLQALRLRLKKKVRNT